MPSADTVTSGDRLALAAPRRQAAPLAAVNARMSEEIILKEGTMARVGSLRVGCGNFWEREHTLPDGSTTTAMSARLAIVDDAVFVGEGSEVVIDGARYRVVAVEKTQGASGRLRLRRLT
jgi:hypothetical protein